MESKRCVRMIRYQGIRRVPLRGFEPDECSQSLSPPPHLPNPKPKSLCPILFMLLAFAEPGKPKT